MAIPTEIVPAKPKPVYVKPPARKPKRLGTYLYTRPAPENDWDGTVLVWISEDGDFWCVHPISGQWISENTLGRVLHEAALDMPGSSDVFLKLTCDFIGGGGLEVVKVRYDFQHKSWYEDGTPAGVPRKYTQRRLYEIPDGPTLLNMAEVCAQRHVLELRGSVHWRAISALRPLNEANTEIAQRIVKRLADAIVPERVEPPPPEASGDSVQEGDEPVSTSGLV